MCVLDVYSAINLVEIFFYVHRKATELATLYSELVYVPLAIIINTRLWESYKQFCGSILVIWHIRPLQEFPIRKLKMLILNDVLSICFLKVSISRGIFFRGPW